MSQFQRVHLALGVLIIACIAALSARAADPAKAHADTCTATTPSVGQPHTPGERRCVRTFFKFTQAQHAMAPEIRPSGPNSQSMTLLLSRHDMKDL